MLISIMAYYDTQTSQFIDGVLGKTAAVTKTTPEPEKVSYTPLQLYQFLNTNYDRQWMDWEPETLWTTLLQDHEEKPTESMKNLIQALQVIVRTNAPFEQWNVFEKVGHSKVFNI